MLMWSLGWDSTFLGGFETRQTDRKKGGRSRLSGLPVMKKVMVRGSLPCRNCPVSMLCTVKFFNSTIPCRITSLYLGRFNHSSTVVIVTLNTVSEPLISSTYGI